MPAIEITDTKGLIQKTGTGVTSTSAVTLSGGLTVEGSFTNNYMDYLAGFQGNLATGITISDAEAEP